MRKSIFFVIAAVALFSVVCCASESKEQDLGDALLSAFYATDPEPQERDCRKFLGACTQTSDCCKHLACHNKHKWCAWDWTICK
uniref:GTx1-13-1 n=2 Tax=Grammostola rosea TaxID=432528 RepID=M5AXM9_GRARO|nr:GTx1-13-1 [Grammostola rosea]BAN13510.1 GTx1-13-2 [Grammostola rosea]